MSAGRNLGGKQHGIKRRALHCCRAPVPRSYNNTLSALPTSQHHPFTSFDRFRRFFIRCSFFAEYCDYSQDQSCLAVCQLFTNLLRCVFKPLLLRKLLLPFFDGLLTFVDLCLLLVLHFSARQYSVLVYVSLSVRHPLLQLPYRILTLSFRGSPLPSLAQLLALLRIVRAAFSRFLPWSQSISRRFRR